MSESVLDGKVIALQIMIDRWEREASYAESQGRYERAGTYLVCAKEIKTLIEHGERA